MFKFAISADEAAGVPTAYSVALGCPIWAAVIHTVRLESSMQYQILPRAVTSYCHCSISVPFTARCPSECFSRCCLRLRRRGSLVMASHAVRALLGAAAQTSPQLEAAALLANRKSHPPAAGGGATRSLRRAIGCQPAGLGTASPVACTGLVSCRCRSGSACISAVAFHSRTSCATGVYTSTVAAASSVLVSS